MSEAVEKIEYYMKLPFGIVLRPDEEQDWIARVEELSGCLAHGATPAEALERVEEVKRLWLEDALEAGETIPEPRLDTDLPSGKWLQRVPRSLHKRLAEIAQQEGVSLNQFVTSVLSQAVGGRIEATPRYELTKQTTWADLTYGAREHRNSLYHVFLIDNQKPVGMSNWNVQEPKLKSVIELNELHDLIGAQILALPNKINESDFKVMDRAVKKEFDYKA